MEDPAHSSKALSVLPWGKYLIDWLSFSGQAGDMPDVAVLAPAKGCVVRGINVGSKQILEGLVRFVLN
jgi:hypothetical protein